MQKSHFHPQLKHWFFLKSPTTFRLPGVWKLNSYALGVLEWHLGTEKQDLRQLQTTAIGWESTCSEEKKLWWNNYHYHAIWIALEARILLHPCPHSGLQSECGRTGSNMGCCFRCWGPRFLFSTSHSVRPWYRNGSSYIKQRGSAAKCVFYNSIILDHCCVSLHFPVHKLVSLPGMIFQGSPIYIVFIIES